MKVLETNHSAYIGTNEYNQPIYREYTSKRNIDGPEILKWMKQLAKVEAFGMVEIPVFRGEALGRFMVMDALHQNHVMMFVVNPNCGLIKQFININSLYFTNNGSATQYGAMSKEKVMMSLLKNKDGKRISLEDKKHLVNFKSRMLDMIAKGGIIPKPSPIQTLVRQQLDIELPSNVKTMEQLNEFLSNNGVEKEYPSQGDVWMSSYHNHKQLIEDEIPTLMTY